MIDERAFAKDAPSRRVVGPVAVESYNAPLDAQNSPIIPAFSDRVIHGDDVHRSQLQRRCRAGAE